MLRRHVRPRAHALFAPTRRLIFTTTARTRSFGEYEVLPSSSAMTAYPPVRQVPAHIPRPSYVPRNFFTAPWGEHDSAVYPDVKEDAIIRGEEEVEKVRKVARMAAEILKEIEEVVRPGTTTDDIDALVHEKIIARGAYPSPLGISSFPRSCTTSVNNIIAHGIPDQRKLLADDIINVDLTVFYEGYHGDTSQTFCLPSVDNAGRDLVDATREALSLAVKECGPGQEFGAIGAVIEKFAVKHGFSVNRQFSGHGIGRHFHQPPWIYHYYERNRALMRPGHCFTIEPCLVQGTNARGFMWDDGWTMATESGARSAQFEHQVLMTSDGVQVLTQA